MPVNNNVKELRRQLQITQLKMAEDLHITRQTIIAIEKNKYNPSLELALKIADYFHVPFGEVFQLTGEDES
nr:helix-turn-helix transcriptional regulator [Evansella caseinilytica]